MERSESFLLHRQKAAERMEDNTFLVSFAGIPLHANEDDYLPFEVNSQFFWLTGLTREHMAFIMSKRGEEISQWLFIEESDPLQERWHGKMPTKEDASAASGIPADRILWTTDLNNVLRSLNWRGDPQGAYFDTFRYDSGDMEDYNLRRAKEFAEQYPTIPLKNLHSLIAPLRCIKDGFEVETVKTAGRITGEGLEEVLRRLEPGMTEYQAQAVFEGACHYRGVTKFSFPTIAGSGINACSMHYVSNDAVMREGDLLLLDLGAKVGNYCADITRTYPVNGKYSPRQKAFYDLVLKANRAVAAEAKPGMTLGDLNNLTRKILGEGLVELGLLKDAKDVGKYYMHSVSHPIGIDCHDASVDSTLQPGWIISDEPGLYIDEESIGIRIEDDLLITEEGCICLTEPVLRETEAIETFMAETRKK